MTGTEESNRVERAASETGGVSVGRDGDRASVRMWGAHDPSTVGLILGAMAEALALDDLDVVVDLSDVAFMDGSTVGALDRGCAALADRDRRLTVRYPTPFQRRLLQICDLADLIEPTRAGDRSHERSAATALETWVEVPAAPRSARRRRR